MTALVAIHAQLDHLNGEIVSLRESLSVSQVTTSFMQLTAGQAGRTNIAVSLCAAPSTIRCRWSPDCPVDRVEYRHLFHGFKMSTYSGIPRR